MKARTSKKPIAKMHWSQMTKNKKGKKVSVGGQAWAKKMAAMRKGKK